MKTSKKKTKTETKPETKAKKDEKFVSALALPPKRSPGIFKLIPANELKIAIYQRGPKLNVRRIAACFHWAVFGCLAVVYRLSDKMWYVIDGGQRLRAYQLLYGVETKNPLPCFVHPSPSIESEAEYFKMINAWRVKFIPHEIWVADQVAQNPTVLAIDNFLQSIGFHVSRNARETGGVSFIPSLIHTWTTHVAATKAALSLQASINGHGEPMMAMVHNGFYWLYVRGLNPAPYLKTLRSEGPTGIKAAVVHYIKSRAGRINGDKAWGLGIWCGLLGMPYADQPTEVPPAPKQDPTVQGTFKTSKTTGTFRASVAA